jgi:hypothetical protein
MTDLRLYLFECGTIRLKLHDIKMNQGLNELYRIPVPWFFIQHPKGGKTSSRDTSRHFDHSNANLAFMSRSNRPYGFTCSHINGVRAA